MTGLLQLVAYNSVNNYFPINYSLTPYNILSNTDNPLIITRTFDSILINGFVIKSCDINNIKNLQIIFGGSIIYSMPMNLLLMTSRIIYNNNNYHIIINKKLFFNDHPEIFMIALSYMPVTVVFKTRKNISIDYELMLLGKQYQTEQRREYEQNLISNEIYQYQTFKIKTNEVTKIKPKLVTTNIFVETRYPITNFKLSANGISVFDYNANMIVFRQCLITKRKLWSKKHLLALKFSLGMFIPLDIIKEIEAYCISNDVFLYCFCISSESWQNTDPNATFNFTRIDETKILIETLNNDNKCKVYFQNYNILHYTSGLAGIKYLH